MSQSSGVNSIDMLQLTQLQHIPLCLPTARELWEINLCRDNIDQQILIELDNDTVFEHCTANETI